jgi:hypothetical protein
MHKQVLRSRLFFLEKVRVEKVAMIFSENNLKPACLLGLSAVTPRKTRMFTGFARGLTLKK